MSLTKREAAKLWRLIRDYARAYGANAVIQSDADGSEDEDSINRIARREKAKEDVRRERVREYLDGLSRGGR